MPAPHFSGCLRSLVDETPGHRRRVRTRRWWQRGGLAGNPEAGSDAIGDLRRWRPVAAHARRAGAASDPSFFNCGSAWAWRIDCGLIRTTLRFDVDRACPVQEIERPEKHGDTPACRPRTPFRVERLPGSIHARRAGRLPGRRFMLLFHGDKSIVRSPGRVG